MGAPLVSNAAWVTVHQKLDFKLEVSRMPHPEIHVSDWPVPEEPVDMAVPIERRLRADVLRVFLGRCP